MASASPAEAATPVKQKGAKPALTPRDMSILAYLEAVGGYKTLVMALKAAKLDDALGEKSASVYTVFAPGDAAFAALPEGELDRLLQPGNRDELRQILKNHIVRGSYLVKELALKQTVHSLNGAAHTVLGTEKGFLVDNIPIGKSDATCKNGVVHEIPALLIPAESEGTAGQTAAGGSQSG